MRTATRLAALGVALVIGLTGCAGTTAAPKKTEAASSGPVELTWWTWWTGAPAIAEKYNASHKKIQIKVENVGGGSEQFTKLNQAVRAGEGPDLALAEYQWLPSYLTAGVAADITKYVGDIKKSYEPSVWNLVNLGDKVYGVPLDQAPMLYIYRADLFEKYGIEVPKTWDEFAAAARKVHAADPSVYLSTMPSQDAGWFAGLAAQAGEQWFDQKKNQWSVKIDSAAGLKVADYWNGLVKDGVVATDMYQTTEFNTMMASDRLLSLPTGSWFATGLSVFNGAPDTVGKWAIAPLPGWKAGEKVAFQGGSASLVTTVSKHPKEAAEFLSWLGADKDGQRAMIEAGGNFPASLPGLKAYASIPLSEQRAAYKQKDFHDILGKVAKNTVKVTWAPNTMIAFSSYTDEIGRAITNKTPFTDALKKVQATTKADLKKSGFEVK
jgi:multiple sugar transport system substrate-binding protein